MHGKPSNLKMRIFHIPSSFTLIELLVVIAIISMLTALLTPTLREAKESAYAVTCMSNLHQTSVALALYGEDRRIYPASTALVPGFGNISWYAKLGPYLEKTATNSAGLPFFRTNVSAVLSCPSSPIKRNNNGFNPAYACHYRIFRDQLSSVTPETAYPFLERPAEVIVVMDAVQWADRNEGCWPYILFTGVGAGAANNYNPATADNLLSTGPDADSWAICAPSGYTTWPRWRHKGKANALFLDGHIGSLSKSEFFERNLKVTPPPGSPGSW